MAFAHSKNTVIKVGATDLSAFTDNSSFPRKADAQEVTTYGKSAKVYEGGLTDATFTMSGTYDSAASATPRVVLSGQEGTTVSITRQPEGAGSGKPQQVFDAVVTQYQETNAVADFIKWSADFQVSDDIDDTAQSA